MHYGQIIKTDTANGVGIRLSLFVSGCTNKCVGCFQPTTWDFGFGQVYTEKVQQEILDEVGKPYYDGLTILGGDPFELQNQKEVAELCLKLKQLYPNKTIWAYTGFIYDKDLIPGGKRYGEYTNQILDNLDVLVDGPFIVSKLDVRLNYRGSSNQRLIDIPKTRGTGKVSVVDETVFN